MKASKRRRALLATLTLGLTLLSAPDSRGDGGLVQYGKLREAIGQKRDHGRVVLRELADKPHFYGVGALEGLSGEVTIEDGLVVATTVDVSGAIRPAAPSDDRQATVLAGAYVAAWSRRSVPKDVAPADFDRFIAQQAEAAGIDASKPFVFLVEGEFGGARIHVINGACPVHARIKNTTVSKDRQPYEASLASVAGRLVGVYAKDAVGDLTQPATSVHAHLVFRDEKSGDLLTAHAEQIGLRAGAVLSFPE